MLAHNVAGGLPVPAWLLGYLGAVAVGITAVGLRSAWPASRLAVTTADADEPTGPAEGTRVGVGHLLGLALLATVLTIAIVGPDSAAANLAPTAVLVIWWVGLPLVAFAVGDIMRAINPFVPVVALVDRLRQRGADAAERAAAPPWTAAAFLAAFSWFLLAYHAPGSPRALAAFLALYAVGALAGALWWGQGWLADGDAFAGLSRAVSLLSLRRRAAAWDGLLPLVVVWLGSAAFSTLSLTTFWADVDGSNRGWSRTLLDTVGLVWMIATVAAAVLLLLRLTGGSERQRSNRSLGLALLPVALAWFAAQNLGYLLLEGQNFYVLLSDPIGRGWDLFGTIDHTIDFGLAQGDWVSWAQIAALLAGHVVAVVLAHDGAIARVGRREGVRTTWCVAAACAASIVAAAVGVVG